MSGCAEADLKHKGMRDTKERTGRKTYRFFFVLISKTAYGKDGNDMEQVTREDFQVIDNCLMIRLPEEIDHHGAGLICESADRLLLREDVCNVVFDFENTRFMDSSGIGIIMGRYRKISCFGGKVYAIHADRQIQRILRLSGLNKIVEVLES